MGIIGLFMIVSGLFGAFLFNINVSWGDKTAVVIRNVLIGISVLGAVFLGIGIYIHHRLPVYEYMINAHYIDGSTEMLMFESKYDPKINACRGTYWLEYVGYNKLGVVRIEIIKKTEKKND